MGVATLLPFVGFGFGSEHTFFFFCLVFEGVTTSADTAWIFSLEIAVSKQGKKKKETNNSKKMQITKHTNKQTTKEKKKKKKKRKKPTNNSIIKVRNSEAALAAVCRSCFQSRRNGVYVCICMCVCMYVCMCVCMYDR